MLRQELVFDLELFKPVVQQTLGILVVDQFLIFVLDLIKLVQQTLGILGVDQFLIFVLKIYKTDMYVSLRALANFSQNLFCNVNKLFDLIMILKSNHFSNA